MPLIACSRMYNVTRRAAEAWRQLFDWMKKIADCDLEVVDYPAPAPLEALWDREDLGCVFMCGWPFSTSAPRPVVVAAPVPRGERYGGEPVYFTDFVVRRDKGFRRLEDTFGLRLAWTVGGSHSGFNAPRHHLLGYRSEHRPVLYAETVGPVISPVGALESVIEDRADIAPLDSYALDLIRLHEPERLEPVEVIASTAAAPIPLLVASPGVDPRAVEAIRQALLAADSDREVRPVLETLSLLSFAAPRPGDYDVIAERGDSAERAGYPYPA